MNPQKSIFVLFLWNFLSLTASTLQCKSSKNCLCSSIQSYYEYQCPMEESNIVVKVYPEYGLHVQCLTEINWNDTENLPSIQLGNVKAVVFRRCPVPSTKLADLLKSFGVNNTEELQFDFSRYFENVTLTSDFFGGLEGLEKLVLSDNNIKNIEGDVFKLLWNLTEVDLRHNTIQLSENLFKHSSQLKRLDLSQNNLQYIPLRLFHNLKQLRILHMWSNNLTYLNVTIFNNLHDLQVLELRNNRLHDLPSNIFDDLRNVKVISLAMNNLESIPNDVFQKNIFIEEIKLERNPSLRHLPDYSFSNLTKLMIVSLNDCDLMKLPETLFEGSTRIQKIFLQFNGIEGLPPNVFKGLEDLEYLDLSYNNITFLSDALFFSTTKLKTLNLRNNNIAMLSQKVFTNLHKLEVINLERNDIRSIDIGTFESAKNLKEIMLSHNKLQLEETITIVSPFNNNLLLEKVYLSHNFITNINEDWMLSKINLKYLDLSFNEINVLYFSSLMAVSKKLQVNLKNNNISTVHFEEAEALAISQQNVDSSSKVDRNIVVQLDGNPIVCDCNIFDFVRYFDKTIDPLVPTLVTIEADDLLCAQPPEFTELLVSQLRPSMLTCTTNSYGEAIKCPNNCICANRPWDKSFIVDCSNRGLKEAPILELPSGIKFNQTEVRLQGNFLTSAPAEHMGYDNVTRLILSNNKIDEVAWIPPQINAMYLDNNNISILDWEILSTFNSSNISTLLLGDNPWVCDCMTKNFSDFLVSQINTKQIDRDNIYCKNLGMPLLLVNINELCPTYTRMIITISVTLTLIMFLIAAITVVFYRNEHEIKVWLFAHNMLLSFVTEEEIDKDKQYDAFISYSHKEEDFVLNKLLPVLEEGPHPYKLCVHIRDWIAGEFIPKQIARSVEDSRRTLVVLSQSFLQSVWGKMEFRTAHTKAMAEGRARVVLILYGDIDLNNDLDDELKAYIKTNTYVKWGDPWFWDKLRYALPHSQIKSSKRSQKNNNIILTLNDKLDLINGMPTTPNLGTTPPAIETMEPPLLLKNGPLSFKSNQTLTPPAESGLNPLLVSVNK